MERPLRYLLPGMLLLLAVACGSDAVPATSIPPTSVPFVPPPTVTSVADVFAGAAALLGLESVREFPEELKSDSPPLDREEAAEIARVFLSNTRMVGSPSITDYCSDGSGQIFVAPRIYPAFDGALFQWEVLPNLAGRWNEPRVLMTFDDPYFVTLLEAAGLSAITWILDEEVIDEESPGAVYGNPSCGQ